MSRALMPGRATIEGTRIAARRYGGAVRRLGRLELEVAPIGFGGYRIHTDSPVHRQALEEALRAGVNLVDTSANYTGGGSERLIGEVLATLVTQGVVRREEVVVVSKAGYIQGAPLEAMTKGELPRPPEVVEYQPTCWHCLHPDFLAAQIEASRERLGLATIDVLLLHNPEYLLIDRRNRHGAVTPADREELLRRIAAAFSFLEGQVERGVIGAYGVSSNAFAGAEEDPEFVSLARLVDLAAATCGPNNRFAVVQMPLNLYETGPLRRRQATREGPRSALEIAAQADLGVLTNRPLSAFIRGEGEPRMVRLADVGGRTGGRVRDSAPLLRAVCELEERWRLDLGRVLAATSGDDRFTELFRWGEELTRGLETIRDLGHWMQLRNGVIATHMGQLGGILLASLEGEELRRFRGFWEEYGATLGAALDGIEDGFRARAQAVADMISDRLAPALPEPVRGLSLSQRAVFTLLAAPVSCVLVGMRRPAYVHDMRELGGHIGGDEREQIDLWAVVEAFAPSMSVH
ncbi:MAG: aldo/keto reductase [Nannocystaceae bacterium]